MRKVGVVLVALFALPMAVWADAQGPIYENDTLHTVIVTSDTSSAGNLGPGDLIYGFKVLATTAGGACDLIDSSSHQTITTGYIAELREATQHDIVIQMFPWPYSLVTDLSVDVTTATCEIYYKDK